MLKLFITPSLLVFLLIGCGQSNSSEYKEEVLAVADAKAEMTIDGMTCQVGCAVYIDEELGKVSGVVSADVSFENALISFFPLKYYTIHRKPPTNAYKIHYIPTQNTILILINCLKIVV